MLKYSIQIVKCLNFELKRKTGLQMLIISMFQEQILKTTTNEVIFKYLKIIKILYS